MLKKVRGKQSGCSLKVVNYAVKVAVNIIGMELRKKREMAPC